MIEVGDVVKVVNAVSVFYGREFQVIEIGKYVIWLSIKNKSVAFSVNEVSGLKKERVIFT